MLPDALIRRSFDAADINPILNDPRVFESIKLPGMAAGEIEASAIVANPFNVLLMAEGGGIIFAQSEPGIYDVHTAFLKPKRKEERSGPHIRNVCLAAYRWMFLSTDAMILQTRMPAFNRAAIVFAPLVGWQFEFERKGVWPTDKEPADMSYFSLAYEDWVRKEPDLVDRGKAFHQRLDEEFARHKAPIDNHPDDEAHDRYVGACMEMVLAGQPEKAVVLYNRWARFAGYGPIGLVSRSPLLICIGTAVMIVENNNFKVIQCRRQQSSPQA
jgi:hypothetical protein